MKTANSSAPLFVALYVKSRHFHFAFLKSEIEVSPGIHKFVLLTYPTTDFLLNRKLALDPILTSLPNTSPHHRLLMVSLKRSKKLSFTCPNGQYGQEEEAGFCLFWTVLIEFEEKSATTHAYKRADRAMAAAAPRLWTRSLL